MYKVLLVDDEILVRDAIRENINWSNLGYELVGNCQNGKEAKEFIEKYEVDLVLTDIAMPYMDGLELSEYLYTNYPDILIVIFSGYGEFEYAKKAIQFNVSEYLLKPITARELSEVLIKMKMKLEQSKKQEKELDVLTKTYKLYQKNTPVITAKLLSHLVMGTQEPKKCLEELEELGITIGATDYRIAAVEIDIYSELFDTDEKDKKESELMSFVVQNISDEIIRDYGLGLAYKTMENKVFLLIQTNKPRESILAAKKMCEVIKEHIMDAMKLQISIVIGTYVQEVSDLYLSYESAIRALRYRYILGEGILLDMEEMKGKLEGDISIEPQLHQLEQALKTSNRAELDDAFQSMKDMLVENLVGRNRACLYLQQMLKKINDIMIEVEGENAAHMKKRNELLTQIANSRIYEEAHTIIYNYAIVAFQSIITTLHTSGQRQSMRAMDYIKENYSNSNLSLNSICEYLNISTSHFSSIFKETTGETFMEVLTRTRMHKAKELLEQSTLKNYEIAERIGFSDPHYFSIAFKKMEGKTPTEYAREKR